MNPRDLIYKRRRRAVILALVATLAFAGLGRAVFSAAPARALIAENDCEYGDCEGDGGGGEGGWGEGGWGEGGWGEGGWGEGGWGEGGWGEGGWGEGGWDEGGGGWEEGGWDEGGWESDEEGGGLTPEEEESIEIESGDGEIEMGGEEGEDSGEEEGGPLTQEEEESIEIESGDDGKTAQEREEAAEQQQQEDEEFEREWQEEIEEEEKEKAKTIAQRQQDRIEDLEKKRKEELTCRNYRATGEFHDCVQSSPATDLEGQRRRCEREATDLRRDQRRGIAGKGGMREAEIELCFSEVIESSTIGHCNEISAEREALRGSGQPTTSVDNELISCLETRGLERQAAMERARKLRELQERKKGKKGHRTRARH